MHPGDLAAPAARAEPRWKDDTPPAEQVLYRAVRASLAAEVAVLPQVMVTVSGHGRAEEAEADLVVVDPDHGVLVIEVKGGTLYYDATAAVWRRREANGRIVRDPVQQAKRARSIIRSLLRQLRIPVHDVPLRWAVATPDCTLESPGPGILPSSMLLDASSLAAMRDGIAGAQGPLDDTERPIGTERADAIVRVLRGRDVQGIASHAVDVAAHEHRVRALTESHRNVMHRFLAHRRVLVRGAAGTGKTVLALEAAARFAAQGDRVLVTCWHRLLACDIRRRLRARLSVMGSPAAGLVTHEAGGQVVVTDLSALAGDPTPPVGVDPTTWYRERLPNLLTPERTEGRFDVVVLDEAQDPPDLWLLALSGVLHDGGRWYAFADRRQDLFGSDGTLSDFVDVAEELRENFRNSRQIAEFATWFGDVETDCLTGDGPPVTYMRVPADRVVGRTTEIARKLIRDQGFSPGQVAAIWLYHNPLQGAPRSLIEQERSRALVTTNSAAFKGMEREVVVLGVDVRRGRDVQDHKRAIYTAASRARSKLVVLADPDQLRAERLYVLASLFKTDD